MGRHELFIHLLKLALLIDYRSYLLLTLLLLLSKPLFKSSFCFLEMRFEFHKLLLQFGVRFFVGELEADLELIVLSDVFLQGVVFLRDYLFQSIEFLLQISDLLLPFLL